MGSEKLEPCPMCGGPAVNVGFEYITCGVPSRCDAHSWLYSDTEMEWNEMSKALRARVSALEQKLAAVEAEVEHWRMVGAGTLVALSGGDVSGFNPTRREGMPMIEDALALRSKLAAVERRNGELVKWIDTWEYSGLGPLTQDEITAARRQQGGDRA